MSRPEQLASTSSAEEKDTVPELPATPSLAGVHANPARHSPHTPYQSPRAPYSDGTHLERQASHVSSVDVGFFDPSGVDRLRRTLSHMSTEAPRKSPGTESVRSTQETAVSEEEKFDLEKCLREIMRKCVPTSFACLAELTDSCAIF